MPDTLRNWPLVHFYNVQLWLAMTPEQRLLEIDKIDVGDMICVLHPCNQVMPFPADKGEYHLCRRINVMFAIEPDPPCRGLSSMSYIEFKRQMIVDMYGHELYAWERVK